MSKELESVTVTAIPETESKEEVHVNNPYGANPNPSKDRSFVAWFDKNDGPVERRLILKLDFLILSFACMGFWVRKLPKCVKFKSLTASQIMYIDRGILGNAYVSGMKEGEMFGQPMDVHAANAQQT
jgi:hypothetical protein